MTHTHSHTWRVLFAASTDHFNELFYIPRNFLRSFLSSYVQKPRPKDVIKVHREGFKDHLRTEMVFYMALFASD